MTYPLFYSPQVTKAAVNSLVTLDTATSGHAIRSQRLKANDAVLVSDGAGALAEGTIELADAQHTTVRVQHVTVQQPPRVRVNLVQALAKGDRDLLAVEMATELGVDTVTPWQAQRSIVRIRSDRAEKMLGKWQAKVRAAAQQSRRAIIPTVHEPLAGSQVANLHNPMQGHHVLVLHEDGASNITAAVETLSQANTVHIVVGPEGGVAPEELRAIEDAGGIAVKIGTNILRASTAGPVALTLLNQLFERW